MAIELVYSCDRCKGILTYAKLKEDQNLKYKIVSYPLDLNKNLETKGFTRTIVLCTICCNKYEDNLRRFFK